MSIINIEVRDSLSELEWIIPLQRRITIIRGFSGKGKTELVRVLIGRPAGVNINTTLPYVIVNETTWENTLLTESNKIIIIDDLDFISNPKFAGIIKRTVQNNNYYLIFGRDQIGEVYDSEAIDMYRLSYSIQSILDLVTDESGYRHFTVPHYKFGDINI